MNRSLRRSWKDITTVTALVAVVLTLAVVQIPLLAEKIQTELLGPNPDAEETGAHGAVMPALDPIEAVHCRRTRHAHRHGHGLSRGCDVVRSGKGIVVRKRAWWRPDRFGPTTLQTIQTGTRPLRSGESTRFEPLRRGPDSPTPSGVRPLSSERSSTGSSSSPFSLPSGGSPFSGSR